MINIIGARRIFELNNQFRFIEYRVIIKMCIINFKLFIYD